MKFPRLLSQLRALRYLSIFSKTHFHEDPAEWPLIMSSLSQSLETLKLVFPSCTNSLANHVLNPAGQVQQVTSQHARGPSKLINLDHIFPRLHTLCFNRRFESQPAELFTGLPSNLTSLEMAIHLDYSYQGVKFMSLLPRSLLELKGELTIKGHPGNDWASAPPNLEELPDFTLNVAEEVHDYAWLPRTLRKGRISFSDFSEGGPPFSLAIARSLPPMTHSLKVETLDIELSSSPDWIQQLPSNLQSLRLYYPYRSLISLSYLPKTLTFLSIQLTYRMDLRYLISDANAASTFWPPSLKTLSWNALRHSELELLPRSVDFLDITLDGDLEIPEERKVIAQLLPPHLTYLAVSCSSTVFVGKLPASVKHFEAYQKLDGAVVDVLPDSLPTAILSETVLHRPGPEYELIPQRFPTNLTTLSVLSWPCDRFDFFPRTLRTLYINGLVGIKESTLIRHGRMFESLPVSLTHLIIDQGVIYAEEIPLQRLSHMVQLEFLMLRYSRSMSSSILRELPSTLTKLHLPIRYVADEDAPFIPYRLAHLSLTNFALQIPKITPALVEHWPLRALDDLIARNLSDELWELLHQRLADPFLTIYSRSQ